MNRIRFVIAMLLLALTASPTATLAAARAADTPSQQALQRAAALFGAGDWKAAYAAYDSLATRYPKHALSRFRAGAALLGLGRAAQAEAMLREGERLGMPAPQSGYRLAQALAELRRPEAAVAELRRAYSGGMILTASALEADPHLGKLAGNAGFAALADSFDTIALPCKHDPRCREFDFWLGDWDVRAVGAPAGGPASRNVVTLEDSSCVLMEHWAGAGGSTGQSFNLFDRTYGKWRQTWVDNSGGQHDYIGALQNGNMVFEGTTPAPGSSNARVPTRLTFFSLGADSVRQFSQTSPDSGRTWQTNYDLLYLRRKVR